MLAKIPEFLMRQWLNVLALALLMTQSNSAPSLAEQKSSAGSVILIPGALGGVESHAPGGYWRLCSPQSVGLNEWRADYLEHLIKPTSSRNLSYSVDYKSRRQQRRTPLPLYVRRKQYRPVQLTSRRWRSG